MICHTWLLISMGIPYFLLTTVRVDPSINYTVCVLVQSHSNNYFFFYVVAVYSRLPPFKINWLKRTLNLGYIFCSFQRIRFLFQLNLHKRFQKYLLNSGWKKCIDRTYQNPAKYFYVSTTCTLEVVLTTL